MSLEYNDLQAIRKIVEEAVSPLMAEIEALSNDVKEIYDMIAELQRFSEPTKSFSKLDIEHKLLKLHSDLLEAAKQAGITLPSH